MIAGFISTAIIPGTGRGRNLFKITLLFLLSAALFSCTPPPKQPLNLGHWDQMKINHLLSAASKISDPGQKVTFISAAFLGTPYYAQTLMGSSSEPETFVLRLDGVDCFTFLDYVESLRRSSNYSEFLNVLHQVRYQKGSVSFLNRNHFFSQWGNAPLAPLQDVSAQIGGENTRWETKYLNQKEDGTLFLPGYPIKKQIIAFIPPESVDEETLSHLQTGDYIGIYSPRPGLDVSHTGIVIKNGAGTFLRHASSRGFWKRVRDEKLLDYLDNKKGIIIYRPTEPLSF